MEQNEFQDTYYHRQGSGPPTPTQDELSDEPLSSGEPCMAAKYPGDDHFKSLYEDLEDVSDEEISSVADGDVIVNSLYEELEDICDEETRSDVGEEDVADFVDVMEICTEEEDVADFVDVVEICTEEEDVDVVESPGGEEDVTDFIDVVESPKDGTWRNELEYILEDEQPMLDQMDAPLTVDNKMRILAEALDRQQKTLFHIQSLLFHRQL